MVRGGRAGKHGSRPADRRVLRDSGRLQHYSVGVKFKDGTVWLKGRVTSEAQEQAALEVVSEIGGITQIVNNLEVQAAAPNEATVAAKSKARKKKPKTTEARLASDQAAAQIPLDTAAKAPAPQSAAKRRPVSSAKPATCASRPVTTNWGPNRCPIAPAMTGNPGGRHAGVCPRALAAACHRRLRQPNMPNYAWPSYAAYPNYAAVTYPKQYSASAWPYIGPFYPYPQVPLGWRKVSLGMG